MSTLGLLEDQPDEVSMAPLVAPVDQSFTGIHPGWSASTLSPGMPSSLRKKAPEVTPARAAIVSIVGRVAAEAASLLPSAMAPVRPPRPRAPVLRAPRRVVVNASLPSTMTTSH